MSTILSARERELQNLLRQKDAELKQANAELEERGKLLYKTKVAIEQLQSELTASRKEEAVIREEAQRICDEQAAELRGAEEQLGAVQSALAARSTQATSLSARIAELEAELDSARSEARSFGSMAASKERDAHRRLEGLQDELEHAHEQVATLERLLRERSAALTEAKTKMSNLSTDKEEAERRIKELSTKEARLTDDKQKLEQQLTAAQAAAEAAGQQVVAANDLAESRLRDKAAADKEWGRRLAAKDKEAAAKLRDAEFKLKELEEKGASSYLRLSAAEGELSQTNLAIQRQLEDAAEAWGRQMAEVQATCEQRLAGCQRQADVALSDAQHQWQRRLRELEEQWADRLQASENGWARKLAQEQHQFEHAAADWERWRGRVQDEIEAAQVSAAREARQTAAAELEELQARAAAERSNMERSCAVRLQQAEATWAERLSAAQASAAAQLEQSQQRHSLELAKAAEAAALQAAEAEARWRKQLDELKRRWCAEQAASDRAWAAKLEEQHKKWLKERSHLEAATAAQVSAAEATAAAASQSLRAKLEGRIASITACLSQLTAQEEAREAKRQELAAQVEELRNAGASELQRRRSLEATLKQAASLFRRELANKSDEVAALQGQLRGMRHELTTSNAYNAAAVAVATAGAVSASAAGSPVMLRCCSPTVGTTPTAAAAAVNAMTGTKEQDGSRYRCNEAAASGGGGAAAGCAAAAASVVAAELQALRASRANYQSAVLQQQAVRNSLLGSLGDVLQDCATAAGRRSVSPRRSPTRFRVTPASADQHLLRSQWQHRQTHQATPHARKCLFSSPPPAGRQCVRKHNTHAGSNSNTQQPHVNAGGLHSPWQTAFSRQEQPGRLCSEVADDDCRCSSDDGDGSSSSSGSSSVATSGQLEVWQQALSNSLGRAMSKLQPVP